MSEARVESAQAQSVDNWCAKCGHLTTSDQEREQVRIGTRIRYDHVGQCPADRARDLNSKARFVR